MRVDKEIAAWIRAAEDAGWRVEETAQGHLRFKGPKGEMVHIAGHAGRRSTRHNAAAQLRKGGVPIGRGGL